MRATIREGEEPTRSLRLTFAYDESGIRLAAWNRRSKPAPRGHDERVAAPRNGISVELRDDMGVPLFRRLLAEPIAQTVEVVAEAGHLQRLPIARPNGTFIVVVPNLIAAVEISIDAGPDVVLRQQAFASGPAEPQRRRLARFEMPGRS